MPKASKGNLATGKNSRDSRGIIGVFLLIFISIRNICRVFGRFLILSQCDFHRRSLRTFMIVGNSKKRARRLMVDSVKIEHCNLQDSERQRLLPVIGSVPAKSFFI